MASDPSDDDGLVADRERFVASVLGYWEAIHEANPRRGSASTREGDRLVRESAARDRLPELLRPLLSHDAIEVRSAAAAHLLRAGERAAAVPVLQAVARHPTSMAAINARMALIQHGERIVE